MIRGVFISNEELKELEKLAKIGKKIEKTQYRISFKEYLTDEQRRESLTGSMIEQADYIVDSYEEALKDCKELEKAERIADLKCEIVLESIL
jgi:hypothetical protein